MIAPIGTSRPFAALSGPHGLTPEHNVDHFSAMAQEMAENR